jgi:hypothetical protein
VTFSTVLWLIDAREKNGMGSNGKKALAGVQDIRPLADFR